MELKYKVSIAITTIISAFAFGYYSAPEKIKTETKIVEVEKKDSKKEEDINKHKKTIIVKTKTPDGAERTVTVIKDDTDDRTKEKDDVVLDTSKDDTKEVTKSSKKLSIAALAGVNPFSGPPQLIYGAHVQTGLIGPISIGAFGLTNGTIGASLGLNF